MFNVIRPIDAPECLSRANQYNNPEVVFALKEMFHEKCYLCERDEIHDVEVEHFNPQAIGGGRTDWLNLYYSCSRCNSLKSNTHIDLLDCTDPTINVFREMKFTLSFTVGDKIIIESANPNPSAQTSNTVALLNLCYNCTNSALRGISRETLIEQIYQYMYTFMTARSLLKNKSTGDSIKSEALETISAMLDVKHPFSAFWRWSYLGDQFLLKKYPQLEDGF